MTVKTVTKMPRLAAGDVVYAVAPNSFRVDVCRIHEIVTRKSTSGVTTQYHVMWSDGSVGPTLPGAVVFKRLDELSKHLTDVARAELDKVIGAVQDERRRLGWDDGPTAEIPKREAGTDQ